MKYRGKGIKWTEAEDREVLEGKSPKGRTPSQVYNRRCKLKMQFSDVTRKLCNKLLWRLEYMMKMKLNKQNDRKFFTDAAGRMLEICYNSSKENSHG